jgi:hypothetical protein
MDVTTTHGLTTCQVSADEALRTDWAARRDELDLVRVVHPEPSSWLALRQAGFAVHPAWITWISPVEASEDAFLDRLSGKERRNIRSGQRFVAEAGIRMKVVAPLDPPSFDAFLELYDIQIGTMRHGVPYARLEREEILDQGGDYFAVLAVAEDGLAGCCVCRIRADISTVVIRFATTAPDSRQHRIVRAMYMQAFQTARELRHRDISLGSDPALYGHITKPGLFSFKSLLRFVPIPARLFGSMDDPDEATRVLRLDALTEPSLLLSYQLSAGTTRITEETPLRLDVLTGDPGTDLRPYRAPFLADLGVRRIP